MMRGKSAALGQDAATIYRKFGWDAVAWRWVGKTENIFTYVAH